MITKKKTKFALFFGNRGFMPESLALEARTEVSKAVTDAGYEFIIMDEKATRYGSVETREEGRIYAQWLKEHEGQYDGVILSMPNFSNENGAVLALEECGKPILIQAYPDEIGKMGFDQRRDAYCGKFSILDVFRQYRVPFTALKPHVVHPSTEAFAQNVRDFAAVCRVVNGMRKFTIGCFGARTTEFKTVRFDEITLQKYGITVETFDLSELIHRVQCMKDERPEVVAKRLILLNYSDCSNVPDDKLTIIAKISVVLDDYIAEYHLQALSIRCWTELQSILGVTPCVILSELNERGIVASCEIDICTAINMYSLQLAAEEPAACLDWNNNYGDDSDKAILFHCGPVAQSLMKGKGTVTDHKMVAKTAPGCGWGSNEGRIRSFPMTYSNCITEDGMLTFYVDEGEFTNDIIEDRFFGCAGVAQIPDLQNKLLTMGRGGFRHHTAVGVGHYKSVLYEAFKYYLGYEILELER
ncbi:L-fucose/L-arabinose isomerase family protein [Paenibacillus sp. Dod16]|uniref:L-fucose/L-arabinose isomerase family protein n=1 Tax=unclassified Paenibacillus TaxID=185978 RepID=UPI0035BF94CD